VYTVFVTGPTGSGKSTLIAALCGSGFVEPSLVHRVDCPVSLGHSASSVAEFVSDMPVDAYLESFDADALEVAFPVERLNAASMEPALVRIRLDDRPGAKTGEFLRCRRGEVEYVRLSGPSVMLECGIEFVEVPERAAGDALTNVAERADLVVVVLSEKGFESDFLEWLADIWSELPQRHDVLMLVLLNMEDARKHEDASDAVKAAAEAFAHVGFTNAEKLIGPVWLGSPSAARDVARVRRLIVARMIERLKRLEDVGSDA